MFSDTISPIILGYEEKYQWYIFFPFVVCRTNIITKHMVLVYFVICTLLMSMLLTS